MCFFDITFMPLEIQPRPNSFVVNKQLPSSVSQPDHFILDQPHEKQQGAHVSRHQHVDHVGPVVVAGEWADYE